MSLDAVAGEAAAAAHRAAVRSGVEIRLLSSLPELAAVYDLYDRIWRPDPGNPPVTIEQLRAMTHAGNYAAGAYDGDALIGACVGFFGLAPPRSPLGTARPAPEFSLHSHVAGVAAGARRRNVGFALKLHQRAWALARGVREVTWTFDPLIRRNAYFNLVKLAARPRDYLVDFYGDIDDAVNAGQGSDRLLMAWDLTAPQVAAACAGRPGEDEVAGAVPVLSVSESGGPHRQSPASGTVLVAIPPDIEQVRRLDPAAALAWRLAVREVLGGLLDRGGRVIGFSRVGGYLVEVRS